MRGLLPKPACPCWSHAQMQKMQIALWRMCLSIKTTYTRLRIDRCWNDVDLLRPLIKPIVSVFWFPVIHIYPKITSLYIFSLYFCPFSSLAIAFTSKEADSGWKVLFYFISSRIFFSSNLPSITDTVRVTSSCICSTGFHWSYFLMNVGRLWTRLSSIRNGFLQNHLSVAGYLSP